MSACSYCGCSIANSKDHVIPRFLGGRATVPACRPCNSRFGHTFEGAAANQFLSWALMLYSWGVPVKQMQRWCEGAYEADGALLDLRIGEHGVEARLNKPFLRYEAAEITEAYLRSPKEERAFVESMRRHDPKSDWRPAGHVVTTNLAGLRAQFELGGPAQQLALKMMIAAATRLPRLRQKDVVPAVSLLHQSFLDQTSVIAQYFENVPEIENRRVPLAHTVYVEHDDHRVRGVVQFFGAFQIYAAVASKTVRPGREAALFVADPVAGTTSEEMMVPVQLKEPPLWYRGEEMAQGLQQAINTLISAARARGATRELQLRVNAQVTPCFLASSDGSRWQR